MLPSVRLIPRSSNLNLQELRFVRTGHNLYRLLCILWTLQ